MKNKDNFTEAPYNEFDAPIPGQSLTDTPGNAPWEHPPQYTGPELVLDGLYASASPSLTPKLDEASDAGSEGNAADAT